MTSRPPERDGADPLVRKVGVHAERHRRWRGEGEASVARRLAQIGVLGWIIVLPTLLGVFVGRWLDRLAHTGLMFAGACLVLGLALGAWSGWKWMNAQ